MKRKILVVDDSANIRKIIQLTFEGLYEVIPIENAEMALLFLENHGLPDIFLIDANMPGMTGYELSKILKSTEISALVPIILMIGTFDTFDDELGKDSNHDLLVTKPFDSDLIIRTIDEQIEKGDERRIIFKAKQKSVSTIPVDFESPLNLTQTESDNIGEEPGEGEDESVDESVDENGDENGMIAEEPELNDAQNIESESSPSPDEEDEHTHTENKGEQIDDPPYQYQPSHEEQINEEISETAEFDEETSELAQTADESIEENGELERIESDDMDSHSSKMDDEISDFKEIDQEKDKPSSDEVTISEEETFSTREEEPQNLDDETFPAAEETDPHDLDEEPTRPIQIDAILDQIEDMDDENTLTETPGPEHTNEMIEEPDEETVLDELPEEESESISPDSRSSQPDDLGDELEKPDPVISDDEEETYFESIEEVPETNHSDQEKEFAEQLPEAATSSPSEIISHDTKSPEKDEDQEIQIDSTEPEQNDDVSINFVGADSRALTRSEKISFKFQTHPETTEEQNSTHAQETVELTPLEIDKVAAYLIDQYGENLADMIAQRVVDQVMSQLSSRLLKNLANILKETD